MQVKITLKFDEENAGEEQVISIKKKDDYYPSISDFKIFSNGEELTYLVDGHISIKLKDVEQWSIGIPNSILNKNY